MKIGSIFAQYIKSNNQKDLHTIWSIYYSLQFSSNMHAFFYFLINWGVLDNSLCAIVPKQCRKD